VRPFVQQRDEHSLLILSALVSRIRQSRSSVLLHAQGQRDNDKCGRFEVQNRGLQSAAQFRLKRRSRKYKVLSCTYSQSQTLAVIFQKCELQAAAAAAAAAHSAMWLTPVIDICDAVLTACRLRCGVHTTLLTSKVLCEC
jgi:hypothetical protein